MASKCTHVALLRGVNVGGKNRLAMADLAALFVAAGCQDVQTYVQSGNVLYRAPAKIVKGLPAVIAAELQAKLGLDVPVVVRSASELRRAVEANPFLAKKADPETLHVMFLAAAPRPAAVAALDAKRSPPDAFMVRNQEVYLCLPNGVARTKLTNAYFDRALATVSTQRNWRTVLELMARMGG